MSHSLNLIFDKSDYFYRFLKTQLKFDAAKYHESD